MLTLSLTLTLIFFYLQINFKSVQLVPTFLQAALSFLPRKVGVNVAIVLLFQFSETLSINDTVIVYLPGVEIVPSQVRDRLRVRDFG
jgi:hypothetical protein